MRVLLTLSCLMLAACGGAEQRFLLDSSSPVAASQVNLRVATLEVRSVSLPSYAEESQILAEGNDGALTPIAGALWADDPVRAATLLLADQIGRATTATVSAEPWPLESDPQAAVHVRVSEMVARANGQFQLSGQYAVSSYDRIVRERIVRFDFAVPLAEATPGGIARASGAAMSQLANNIIAELSR